MAFSLSLLFQLVEQAGTLEAVRDLLRAKQRPFSAGSWEFMFKERVRPALEAGALSEDDLLALLRDSEEYGRQHVFLFKRTTGTGLPDNGAIRRWLKRSGAEDVIERPLLVDKPGQATIAEVRRERGKGGDNLVVKIVETRTYKTRVSEVEQGSRTIVTYERETVRAINVVRLHSDGMLEVRVYSHRNAGGDYSRELSRLIKVVSGIFPPIHYVDWSLHRAKAALLDQHHALNGTIRYSDTEIRSDKGSIFHLTTGPQEADLFADAAAEEGHKGFTKQGNTSCSGLNVWWRAQKLGPPSRDVHVLLSGEPNEFAVTQQCTPSDYEHVFAAIRSLNR